MAIKKYFVDNERYGVDAMNAIVAGLRTTGVDGEIANGLLVSKNGDLEVNIAPGRGWVDGCQIELTETESRAVASTAGTYSVIMQLSKTGDQTDNIDIAVVSGVMAGAHVLAQVTVSEGVITTVTDVRKNSHAVGVGNTTIPVSIQCGKEELSGTLADGETATKVVPISGGAIKVNGFICAGTGTTIRGEKFIEFSLGQGLNFLRGCEYYEVNWTPLHRPVLTLGTSAVAGSSPFDGFGTTSGRIEVRSVEMTATGLAITFENASRYEANLNCTVAWEAWNYDTI